MWCGQSQMLCRADSHVTVMWCGQSRDCYVMRTVTWLLCAADSHVAVMWCDSHARGCYVVRTVMHVTVMWSGQSRTVMWSGQSRREHRRIAVMSRRMHSRSVYIVVLHARYINDRYVDACMYAVYTNRVYTPFVGYISSDQRRNFIVCKIFWLINTCAFYLTQFNR